MSRAVPLCVRIVEVGPRDGLQSESQIVPTETKIAFIDALSGTGLRDIEVTSFVNPKAVPQMSDAMDVLRNIDKAQDVRYSALVPNMRGLDDWLSGADSLESEARGIALFTAASETFNQRNINATIAQSLENFRQIMVRLESEFGSDRPFVRGYVSTAFRCPYEGSIPPGRVERVTRELFELGIDEVSLGDTIGAATPAQVSELLDVVLPSFGVNRIAMHFHDTRGTALANVVAAMQHGISIFDSSAGGLGGCPFAPGASGNLATEDLLYMLNGMGIVTGVDLSKVAKASERIGPAVGHQLPSKELQALSSAGF